MGDAGRVVWCRSVSVRCCYCHALGLLCAQYKKGGGECVSVGKKGERSAGERNECDGGWAACD